MTDHWVAMFPKYGGPWQTQQAFNAAPQVKGVLRRVIWKTLYTLDQIDLTDLKAYLAGVKKAGKKCSLMVEDKTFDGTNPMPDHMKSLAVRTRSNGYAAIRWHDKVRAEYTKLICELQKLPDVHSISIMETAMGLLEQTLTQTGYSPQRYCDYYTQLIRDLNTAVPGKAVFWHTNYFPRDQPGDYIDKALENVFSLRTVRLGGPDWWPTDGGLMNRAYPRYAEWKARGMNTFTMMSSPSYMQYVDGAYLSPKELLDGAVETLKCNNVFWCFTRTPPEMGAYDFYDAAYLMKPT